MSINWLITAQSSQDIPVPTYGNYGGPDYSGGEIIGPGEIPNFTVQPTDPLDGLFQQHDEAYYDPSATPEDLATADLALIQGILALPDDAVTGEGDLYAGAAVLALIYQIGIVNEQPQLLTQLDLPDVVQQAASLIEQGRIEPDAQEIAAIVPWIESTGRALASTGDPNLAQTAQTIEDLVASLDPADAARIQAVLQDNPFHFLSDATPPLEQVVDFIAGLPLDAVESHLAGSDSTPVPQADAAFSADLQAFVHKLAGAAHHDFVL
jgi:hypothetical protein